jgi:hypothetical protein
MPVAGVETVRPVYSSLLPDHGPVIVKLGCPRDIQHEASLLISISWAYQNRCERLLAFTLRCLC